jgi:hypothetical protein
MGEEAEAPTDCAGSVSAGGATLMQAVTMASGMMDVRDMVTLVDAILEASGKPESRHEDPSSRAVTHR